MGACNKFPGGKTSSSSYNLLPTPLCCHFHATILTFRKWNFALHRTVTAVAADLQLIGQTPLFKVPFWPPQSDWGFLWAVLWRYTEGGACAMAQWPVQVWRFSPQNPQTKTLHFETCKSMILQRPRFSSILQKTAMWYINIANCDVVCRRVTQRCTVNWLNIRATRWIYDVIVTCRQCACSHVVNLPPVNSGFRCCMT